MNCTVIMKLTILAFSFVLFTFHEILPRVVKIQEEADKPVNSLESSGGNTHARDAKCRHREAKRSIERKRVRSECKAQARDANCLRSGGDALWRRSAHSREKAHAQDVKCRRSGGDTLWRRSVRSGEKAHARARDAKCRRSGGEALARDAMWVPPRCHHRLSRCLHHC